METLALVGKIGPSAQQLSAIEQFFRATEKLREAKVIRSHRFLGDLGEFLCACTFGITLVPNQREFGLDGHRRDARVQIKYHGGKSTTADLGKPNSYDEVYLVLGPGSVLRRKDDMDGFLVYRFLSKNVKNLKAKGGKFQVSKGGLPAKPVKRILMTP